jgi:hypothetical protein
MDFAAAVNKLQTVFQQVISMIREMPTGPRTGRLHLDPSQVLQDSSFAEWPEVLLWRRHGDQCLCHAILVQQGTGAHPEASMKAKSSLNEAIM